MTGPSRIFAATIDPAELELLSELLAAMDHPLAGHAATVDELAKLVEHGEVELVIVDYEFIRDDEAVEQCSRIYENFGVPVIFITGADDEDLINRTRSCNPSGYVTRPILEQQLRLTVETGLRRRAEDRRQKFEFIADTARDMMTLINRNHVYVATNSAYRASVRGDNNIIGKSVREVWGDKTYYEIIKPKLDACFSGEEVCHEARIEFHERGLGYFDVTYYPYRDDKGHVTHAVVVSHDITKRKLTEEALKASQQRLNSIIETTPDIIYRLDPHGRITFVNNAIRRYGHIPDEMVGKPILDFVHPEDRDRVAHGICERRTGNRRTKFMEVRLLSKRRTQFPVEINIADLDPEPVIMVDAQGLYDGEEPHEDTFIGTQGLARDITERKIAELQIKESLIEKEILLQEIHHRVKNNLQIISNLIDMACRRITDSHSKDIIGDILSKVKSLALIHTKLYASEHFSKINIAGFTLDIYNQISQFDAWRSINPKTVFKLEDVILPVNTAIPVCLFINEALTNIFRHAYPDGEEGTIEIEIARNEDMLRVSISDDGVGIPKDVDTAKPSSMGLKLMSGIAEYQLRGKMEIARGHGSTVSIIFPMDPEYADQQ